MRLEYSQKIKLPNSERMIHVVRIATESGQGVSLATVVESKRGRQRYLCEYPEPHSTAILVAIHQQRNHQ